MKRTALVLIAMVISTCAVAQEKLPPLPKDLPAYGPTVPFHAPKVEVKKLSNGLTLWLVPRPGFPKVAIAIAVRGGMASDPAGEPGLSQLLMATLDQGTKTRNARQIAEDLQAAGGDLSGDSPADVLLVSTDVLAEDTRKGMAVLADVLQNATFPDSEVDLAKRNATENLKGQEADPGFLADRLLAKEVFGSHPYSVVAPTQESISKTQSAEIRSTYAQRFRPDQLILVAVGDFKSETFSADAEQLLGKWQAPAAPAVQAIAKPSAQNPHEVFMIPRPGSVQTTFALASFGPVQADPDYSATQVANAIYGGMFGSRLVRNIREDKGYTYSPGAYLQTRAQAGLLRTVADVRNAVTGATLNEIDYELNRMATTAPTEEEVESAKRYLVGLQAIRLQSQGAVARRLATLWSYGLPPEELGLESERIQKVTAEEVEKAGAKYFPAVRDTIIAVGEEKAVEEQLAPFGLTIHKSAK
ncbi:MAG TPA: pitrilysin family protein [Terriglobia bacterium]|nr:pitrilysin family protein [Terriglobia bacterium]